MHAGSSLSKAHRPLLNIRLPSSWSRIRTAKMTSEVTNVRRVFRDVMASVACGRWRVRVVGDENVMRLA